MKSLLSKTEKKLVYKYTVIVNAQETNYSTNKIVYPKGRLLPKRFCDLKRTSFERF